MKYLLINDLFEHIEKIYDTHKFVALIKKYKKHLPYISTALYSKLDKEDKKRFVLWFLRRWGGVNLVNRIERRFYKNMFSKLENQQDKLIALDDKTYKLQDLSTQGYPFKILTYNWFTNIHDFYYNQYEHKEFRFEKGDIIIDAGGFTGDTSALICYKTSNNCFIHSFELMDENIKLFKYNNKLNNIEPYIKINQLALSDKSHEIVKIKEVKEFETQASIFGDENSQFSVKTITLDDYVLQNDIEKLDMIKLDIEGSEVQALEGARQSIEYFKPKLAICLYHKWDDCIAIPKFLDSLSFEYTYYFKWVALDYGYEAVLLCVPKKEI